MESMFPKFPEHYIYLSQHMGILVMLKDEGFLTLEENDDGAWCFHCIEMKAEEIEAKLDVMLSV